MLFVRDVDFCGTCHDVSNPAVGDLAHNNGTQATGDPVVACVVLGSPVDVKAAFNNLPVAPDNRIPPYGIDYEEARKRNALPVPAAQYGNSGSAGTYNHWDNITLSPPVDAAYAEIKLLYQPTSWEYVHSSSTGPIPGRMPSWPRRASTCSTIRRAQ